MNYLIVVYPSDEGSYVAEIPLAELEIVVKLWIETAEKHGQLLPNVEGAIKKVKALSYR
jgi:predicted RNase H-like HicB family nuclease